MPSASTPVNPAVVRWAREQSGLDRLEAARRLSGVDSNKLATWEEGAGKPTMAQLRSLASLYDRTPAFFFRKDTPESDLPALPDFRSLSGQTQNPLSFALRRQLRACLKRRNAMLELVDHPRVWNPPAISNDKPAAIANHMRQLLNVSIDGQLKAGSNHAMLRIWIHALEDQHILVFQSSQFPIEEARGLSIYNDAFPIILLNGKDAPTGRIFTLFHELGHLIKRNGALCTLRKERSEERWSNTFAAALLMPIEYLHSQIGGNISVNDVRGLARRLKVSRHAMAIHLQRLGYLDQSAVHQIERATAQDMEAQPATDGGPPFNIVRLRDIGRRYASTVLAAYHQDIITLADASYLLGAKIQHLPHIEGTLREWQGEGE